MPSCSIVFIVFFLMIRRPPRSTRTDTLFPYTTLFRSLRAFLRQRLGEAVNAGFGSGVIHLAILPRLAVDRPDIDDPAPAAFAHAGKHRLRHVKAAAEIDVDDFLPHLVGHLQHDRSEEHTSELQSLMRTSYAVF